jgi:ubiquinone/menaquinone biosynthesis C-methylase UbiE
MNQYIFDNAAPQTEQRFSSLEQLFDSWSIQHLAATGIASGWHCLEVGGGSGSLARWMAGQVGPTGRVLVTDINPRFLASIGTQANLEVREHNIVTESLPSATFDLIHERLVLIHLPEREQVLRKLVDALRPGGWLVVEEFDVALVGFGTFTRQPDMKAGVERMSQTLGQLMSERGAHRNLGRDLYGLLNDLGLEEVSAAGSFVVGAGGSTVTDLMRANFAQVRDEAVAAGLIAGTEVDQVLAWMNDPAYTMTSPTLVTAWGRRG